MFKHKKIVPLPFKYYFWPVVALALAGLSDSLYLSISHYRNYMDIGYSSFCAISQSINCDTVSQSPYSILFGMPVPVWGVLGYGTVLFLLYLAWQNRNRQMPLWSIIFLTVLSFSVYSVVLAAISVFFIRSYCIMCIVSYAINLLLLFYIWIIRNRFNAHALRTGLIRDIQWIRKSRPARWCASFIVVIATTGMILFPAYWRYPSEMPVANLSTGITADGHPWIGALQPELEIIEFTDYLCFQCRKMHYYLRNLVARYPDRIRLVHRHFPMDNEVNPIVKEPFHVGSGRMSIIALYAAETGKFWQMNDALFAAGAVEDDIDLEALAEKTGTDLSSLRQSMTKRTDLHMALAKDIWSGIKLEISGTPAYVIDGDVYLAEIPSEILRRVVH
jgi:uncharacterized membrane protein/protein-disulfide isomerase